MNGRPIGITLICVLYFAGGVFTLLSTMSQKNLLGLLHESGISVPLFLVTNFALPIALIAAAYGLWRRASWGWRLGAALAALQLCSSGLTIFFLATPAPAANLLSVLVKTIVPLIELLYLLRASIVMAYGWKREMVQARRGEALGAGVIMACAITLALVNNINS